MANNASNLFAMPKNPKKAEAPYPLQKELFDSLRAGNKNFVQQYTRAYHISKTSAYNRLAGVTPISFDEGCKLLTGTATIPQGQAIFQSELQAAKRIASYLSENSPSEEAAMMLSCRAFPSLYLACSPLVFCLRFFITDWLEAKAQNRRLPAFSSAYCERPRNREFLAGFERALRQMHEIPPRRRFEVWSPAILANLLAKLQEMYALGAFNGEITWQEIGKEVSKLVNTLERIAQQHEVFLSPEVPAGCQLILSSGMTSACWIWADADWVIYTQEAKKIEPIVDLLEKLRACSRAIGPEQHIGQRFFIELRRELRRLWAVTGEEEAREQPIVPFETIRPSAEFE
jgi:hypothetical protein